MFHIEELYCILFSRVECLRTGIKSSTQAFYSSFVRTHIRMPNIYYILLECAKWNTTLIINGFGHIPNTIFDKFSFSLLLFMYVCRLRECLCMCIFQSITCVQCVHDMYVTPHSCTYLYTEHICESKIQMIKMIETYVLKMIRGTHIKLNDRIFVWMSAPFERMRSMRHWMPPNNI